jgi:lipopolysaccharide export system protein LptC
MRGDGSAHSRVVAALRVLLPLSAAALLAALFLLSRSPAPTPTLPFSDLDVEALLREPRMTAPEFAGVTEDGADVSLTAASARVIPDGRGDPSAAEPRLLLATPDGLTYAARAAEARLDPHAQVVVLSGQVVLDSSNGYRIETEALAAALDRTFAETTGPVTAVGPQGRIEAGRMRLDRDGPAADAGYVLVFKDRVKLIYAPAS